MKPLNTYRDGHEFSLEVHGPYSANEALECKYAELPCVYIQTVDFRGWLVHWYIGESGKSFSERMKSHLRMYRTGEFGLYNWNAWQDGRLERIKQSYYRKYTKELRAEFEAVRETYEASIQDSISRLRVFIIPLPGWSASKNKRINKENRTARMKLEQAIGQQLMSNGHPPGCARDLYPHDLDEYRRKEYPENYVALFPETPIYGLPRRLEF